MKERLVAGLALALMVAQGSAWRGGKDWGPCSNATLKGIYVFEAYGFGDDNGGLVSDEIGALGSLIFDGTGKVTGGKLTLIRDQNKPKPVSCTEVIGSGTYSITKSSSAPGIGTLAVVLGHGSKGTLNFLVIVPSPNGKVAQLKEWVTTPNAASICGHAINSLVLKGYLKRIDVAATG
jgi:hypothetical protein